MSQFLPQLISTSSRATGAPVTIRAGRVAPGEMSKINGATMRHTSFAISVGPYLELPSLQISPEIS